MLGEKGLLEKLTCTCTVVPWRLGHLIVLSVKMFKKHIIFIEHNFVKENRSSYDNLIYLASTQLWYSLAPYQIFDQFLHKTLMVSRNLKGLNSYDVLNLH